MASNKFTPADDELHEPTTDDFWWSETYFFQFHIPDAAGFQAGARMLLQRGYV